MNIINVTQARNQLSQLVDDVAKKKEKFILIRESRPQAVLIPWPEYLLQEEKWREQVRLLMGKGKEKFKVWLKKNRKTQPKSERDVYKIIAQATGRR